MKRILLYGLTLLLVLQVSGQDGTRLQALKIAYLTKKLDLSPEEAQRFWPVYNKYDEEIHAAQINAVKDRTPEIDLEEKILGIRKKYSVDFGKVLSAEKVNTFFRAEKEFGNFVRKEIERRQLKMQQRRSLIKP